MRVRRRGAPGSVRSIGPWRSLRSNAAGSVQRVTEERLSLLQVHAHPDDEASKGAGTTAKYAAEGVHNVLVCCTGGEAGDILNPAVEHPGSPEAMYELRMAELAESVRVLGYDVAAPARLPRQRHARHRGRTRGPTTSPTRRSTRPSAGS